LIFELEKFIHSYCKEKIDKTAKAGARGYKCQYFWGVLQGCG
jgi:hypothetical protein